MILNYAKERNPEAVWDYLRLFIKNIYSASLKSDSWTTKGILLNFEVLQKHIDQWKNCLLGKNGEIVLSTSMLISISLIISEQQYGFIFSNLINDVIHFTFIIKRSNCMFLINDLINGHSRDQNTKLGPKVQLKVGVSNFTIFPTGECDEEWILLVSCANEERKPFEIIVRKIQFRNDSYYINF